MKRIYTHRVIRLFRFARMNLTRWGSVRPLRWHWVNWRYECAVGVCPAFILSPPGQLIDVENRLFPSTSFTYGNLLWGRVSFIGTSLLLEAGLVSPQPCFACFHYTRGRGVCSLFFTCRAFYSVVELNSAVAHAKLNPHPSVSPPGQSALLMRLQETIRICWAVMKLIYRVHLSDHLWLYW